jgi:hypothetical protein
MSGTCQLDTMIGLGDWECSLSVTRSFSTKPGPRVQGLLENSPSIPSRILRPASHFLGTRTNASGLDFYSKMTQKVGMPGLFEDYPNRNERKCVTWSYDPCFFVAQNAWKSAPAGMVRVVRVMSWAGPCGLESTPGYRCCPRAFDDLGLLEVPSSTIRHRDLNIKQTGFIEATLVV